MLIAGDDFKSGQTKLKSVLVDFLVGAGLKPTSIVSYNHLGNNDGMNLSAPQTFRSKVSDAWACATLAVLLSGSCTEGWTARAHTCGEYVMLAWPPVRAESS